MIFLARRPRRQDEIVPSDQSRQMASLLTCPSELMFALTLASEPMFALTLEGFGESTKYVVCETLMHDIQIPRRASKYCNERCSGRMKDAFLTTIRAELFPFSNIIAKHV